MDEISKPDESSTSGIPRWAWGVAALFAVAAFLFDLSIPFLGPDEPRYSQVAREMFERGDWVTPMLAGHHWFEKPVLLYWLQIVSFNVFGVSEFAARLGPALFGIATTVTMYLFGKRIVESESGFSSDFPKWVALMTASTLSILAFAHGASFDIIVTFPLTAAIYNFYAADRTERTRNLVFFYFFAGLAVLAKGLIGILFPAAIMGGYYILQWRMPSRKLLLGFIWGPIVSLAVISTWYGPMYARHGWEFIDEFIIQHHFQRFTSNKYKHPQPFIFFWWVLPLMTLPWLPFFFGGVWKAARSVFSKTDSARTLAFVWMMVPLVFFSFSGSKLPGYILPSVPPAILLAALFAAPLISRRAIIGRLTFAAAGIVFISTIAIFVFVMPQFARSDSKKSLIAASNSMGYGEDKVTSIFGVPHSAEFYAAGRLIRDADGELLRMYSGFDLADLMQKRSLPRVLVIVPLAQQKQILESTVVQGQFIDDNGEYAIYMVSPR